MRSVHHYLLFLMLICSRPSIWLIMAFSTISSNFAGQHFPTRTSHTAILYVLRSFTMHRSQRVRFVRTWKTFPQRYISSTFDTWTSAWGDPYLSLTAHYIDAPTDCPNAWFLKSEQLLFQEIQGRHMGKKLGQNLVLCIGKIWAAWCVNLLAIFCLWACHWICGLMFQ